MRKIPPTASGPSPGKILNLHLPGGHGVRVDSRVYAGYTIPPNYDSMIAKLIVSGQSREDVITRMKRALSEFVIEGVKTTIPFHLALMDNATSARASSPQSSSKPRSILSSRKEQQIVRIG